MNALFCDVQRVVGEGRWMHGFEEEMVTIVIDRFENLVGIVHEYHFLTTLS